MPLEQEGCVPIGLKPAPHVSIQASASASVAPSAHATSSAPFSGAARPATVHDTASAQLPETTYCAHLFDRDVPHGPVVTDPK